jgi:tetratricopeptide (TPR) repeat protein
VHFFIALARAQQRRYADALAELIEFDPEGRIPDAQSLRGWVYAMTGRNREARLLLDSLATHPAASLFHSAPIHLALGERARALDVLEKASETRSWQLRLIGVEPLFDPLRTEGRFQALLQKVGLRQGYR